MKRLVIACVIGLCAGAAPSASASTVSSGAQLQGFLCQRALDPTARAIQVTAVMRPITGTAHMALRVVLLHRGQGVHGQLTPVGGHDLGKWLSPPEPTLGQRPGDIWRLVKRVVDLPAGSYRLRVIFRWIGSSGQTLATTSRRTPICDQPELRPDLRVTKISIEPNPSVTGEDHYVAVVRNMGRSVANAFDVQLSLASTIVANKTAGPLAASSKTEVGFDAPPCIAGQSVTVIADPDDKIDDADPTNNSLSVPCPSSSSPAPGSSGPAPAGSSRRGR